MRIADISFHIVQRPGANLAELAAAGQALGPGFSCLSVS